ncbi:MAG: hypothetical protein NTV94_18645 [Planctomycetota bacterium]|nr:hypothetical protein [Planctomycetota bacterium]
MAPPPAVERNATPPVVDRLLWWMALPFAGIVAGAVLFALPAGQAIIAKASAWLSLGIPAFFFTPFFVAIIGIVRGQSRIARAVRAAKGRACTHCVHDLNGLGDAGTCPECGIPFNAAQDQRRWAQVHMLP